jgi:hypothetical protein
MTLNIAENICRPATLGDFPNSFGVLGAGWIPLVLLALLCSLLALSAIYILSKILGGSGIPASSAPSAGMGMAYPGMTQSSALNAWVKFEFFQLFATATLVVLTSSVIIFGMCSFDMSFLDNSLTSHYVSHVSGHEGEPLNMLQIVENYFDDLEGVGYMLFGFLMAVVGYINFIARLALTSHPLGVGFSESPLESLLQLNNLIFMMVSGFVISFLSLNLQLRMMEYISVAALYYMFPFGIFFRAFEPTRAFGGTLMGLAIALFLFYPMLLVFNDFMIYGAITDVTQEMNNSGMLAGANANLSQITSLTHGTDSITSANTAVLMTKVGTGNVASGITTETTWLLKPLMLYFIAAIILPVINFTILVEIARGLTKTLGEEVDVTNLTRLI